MLLSNFVPRGFGFVHHSIAILYHQVPNPNITIRNFFIAILQAVWFAVWGKIAEYLDQALQMLLRAQEQYNEGMDGIGLTVLVRNSVAAGGREEGEAAGGCGLTRAPPSSVPAAGRGSGEEYDASCVTFERCCGTRPFERQLNTASREGLLAALLLPMHRVSGRARVTLN